jgi:hypothetical protein
MANPTFRDIPLFDEAARDLPGSPTPRLRTEAMPGIDGLYLQVLGCGGRQITAQGILSRSGSTPAQAHQDLKDRLRDLQQLVAQGQEGTYVGTDGAVYGHCLLRSYVAEGPVEMTRLGAGGYLAGLSCKAIVQQLVIEQGD